MKFCGFFVVFFEKIIDACTVKQNMWYKDMTAHEFNQEIRGKYFFGIDQAMQNIAYDDEIQTPILVLNFLLNHIKYSV